MGEEVRWRAAGAETVERLLRQLRELDWRWQVAEVPDVLRRLGWSVAVAVDEAGLVVDAGLGLGGQEAIVSYDPPEVDSIDVALTENTRTTTRPALVFLHDTFADLVALATRLFGEPSHRRHGQFPTVEWRDDRTSLALVRGSVTVAATVMSAARREFWDQSEDEPWDG